MKPRMSVTTATLRGDGRANHDTVVVSDRAVAVLDGASGWLPLQEPGRDGGWIARTLGGLLLPVLDQDRPLTELLRQALTDVTNTYDLHPGTAPETTITIARWDAEHLEILALCDSPAVVFGPQPDPVEILDDRLQAVGGEARMRARDHLRAGHGYDPQHRELLAEIQRQELAGQNSDDGYWVAEADPEAANHAYTATYPLEEIEAVLLLTDGAAAGVDEYAHPRTWREALPQVRNSPAAFLEDLHTTEDTDPDGRRWPRAKCHDDKTLALIEPFRTT